MVAKAAVFARYVPSGHLLFVRDGTVFAVGFDAARRRATSAPIRVATPSSPA